jgi:Mitochondrial K+-H+ exchange-related
MKVYLVPAGHDRCELYCEVRPAPPINAEGPGTLRGRLVETFRRMLAEGERVEQDPDAPQRSRFRRAITRRIAEAVAEQRLLWQLRAETAVDLIHPDDLPGPTALATARALLAADFAKHRRWCVVDALVTAVTGPALFFVPGPNVLSWYFAFRAVGHYFAMRGARQGLSCVTWAERPSAELTDLRAVLALDRETRARRVEQISATLGLNRLAFFIERVA